MRPVVFHRPRMTKTPAIDRLALALAVPVGVDDIKASARAALIKRLKLGGEGLATTALAAPGAPCAYAHSS